MNRINEIFKTKNNKIIPFITAGYPSKSDTVNLVLAAEEAGSAMVEIGMPFSDPLADGSIIQNSSQVAISNGVDLKWILNIMEEIRNNTNIPIVLMGYINPVLSYGLDRFIKDCHHVGVDGLIIPDLPIEEAGHYLKLSKDNNICAILLVAPNTPANRIKHISKLSGGLIYCVSMLGVTGVDSSYQNHFIEYMERVSLNSICPYIVGFGIKSREGVIEVNKFSDGAVVGSALIEKLEFAEDPVVEIKKFIKSLII